MDKNRTLAKHSARSLDLKVELDNLVRLCQHARECLEKSLFSGMGYKQDGISRDDVQALSGISIAIERAVSARIKYDKHTKSFAEQMTPQEEREAIEEYIAGLGNTDRHTLIAKLVARHNKIVSNNGNKYEPKLKTGDEDANT